MLMQSVSSQRVYVNTPRKQYSQELMHYLKGSKHSQKMKRLGFVLMQVKVPQKKIHLHLKRITYSKLTFTIKDGRSLHKESERHHAKESPTHKESERHHTKESPTMTQSKTRGTPTNQGTSKREVETAPEQQRSTNQKISESQPNCHTTNLYLINLVYQELVKK